MKKICIMGLANIETNVKINRFPIEYTPIEFSFFGNNTQPSGVGINLAMAFKALEDEPFLYSMTGNDFLGSMIEKFLNDNKIKYAIDKTLSATPESTVLYDHYGKRKIYCDLKDVQEIGFGLNVNDDFDLACITNTNFSRKYLKYFKDKNITIATDCHVVGDINDDFNKDFMRESDILFISDENIRDNYYDFMQQLIKNYNKEIIVISRGELGTLMYVRKDNSLEHYEAFKCLNIVNTCGAGDALFSSFLHFYLETKDPYSSIKNAMKYASIKISSSGGALGFMTLKSFKEMI